MELPLFGKEGSETPVFKILVRALTCTISVSSWSLYLGKTKKIVRVFKVMELKVLGRLGTLIIFNYFFSGKNIILCILKGNFAFQNA